MIDRFGTVTEPVTSCFEYSGVLRPNLSIDRLKAAAFHRHFAEWAFLRKSTETDIRL